MLQSDPPRLRASFLLARSGLEGEMWRVMIFVEAWNQWKRQRLGEFPGKGTSRWNSGAVELAQLGQWNGGVCPASPDQSMPDVTFCLCLKIKLEAHFSRTPALEKPCRVEREGAPLDSSNSLVSNSPPPAFVYFTSNFQSNPS